MSDQVALPTSAQLRHTLAEASRIASSLISSYATPDMTPSHHPTITARLDFLQGLKTDLAFAEASLLKAFTALHPEQSSTLPATFKSYKGNRTIGGTSVVVSTPSPNLLDNRYLKLRKDLLQSPGKTFAWGNTQRLKGLQLAVTILADFVDDSYALATYETFWENVIRDLPAQAWCITGEHLLAWTQDHPATPQH